MHNIWPDQDLRFYREQKGRYVAFIEDICELIGFVRALDTGSATVITGSWCAPRAAEARRVCICDWSVINYGAMEPAAVRRDLCVAAPRRAGRGAS